jgi:hypothetical protein
MENRWAEPAEVRIAVDSSNADRDARALWDWLSSEDELRGRVRQQSKPIAQGEMGSALDVLAVAAGSGGALTVLVKSLSTWLTHRGQDTKIRLTMTEKKVELEFDAGRARDPEALLRAVQALISEADRGTNDR